MGMKSKYTFLGRIPSQASTFEYGGRKPSQVPMEEILHREPKANMGVIRQIQCQAFVVYVAGNMALCAILFAPWALPRESISGLLGRWELTEAGMKQRCGAAISAVVDKVHFWEPNHCNEVYWIEEKARAVLYPESPGAIP